MKELLPRFQVICLAFIFFNIRDTPTVDHCDSTVTKRELTSETLNIEIIFMHVKRKNIAQRSISLC